MESDDVRIEASHSPGLDSLGTELGGEFAIVRPAIPPVPALVTWTSHLRVEVV